MPRRATSQTRAGEEEFLPSSKGYERSVTIHPRVSPEEEQVMKALAQQLDVSVHTLWSECISDGMILTLIKCGPDEMGVYGGRWTPKEIAQIARRRFLNLLIDFQTEQKELPALLHICLETLHSLANSSQQREAPPQTSVTQSDETPTEEDAMVFAQEPANPEEFNESLGGMGFRLLGTPSP